MKVAGIEVGDRPLILAPMEDVTNPPFRKFCKKYGADWLYSEFVSADALVRSVNKSLKKLTIDETERPVTIQIYGRFIDSMVEAAKIVEEVRPDFIDINFGCPVKKVAGKGAGAGMLRDIPKMLEITRAVVNAVKIPVTVKTRLGWDHDSRIIVELAEQLQDCGIAALAIHGRTRSQMYTGEADWSLIGKVKENPRMKIPIIGNGDVTTPQIAREKFEKYGVDAIMVGRRTALLDNPSLTVRNWYGHNPIRVVLDRTLSLPNDLQIFDGNVPTLVFTEKKQPARTNITYISIDFNHNPLEQIMEVLYQRKIQSLLVEGGSQLLQSFINDELWDEAYIEKCPSRLHSGVQAPQMNDNFSYSIEEHFERQFWHYVHRI